MMVIRKSKYSWQVGHYTPYKEFEVLIEFSTRQEAIEFLNYINGSNSDNRWY